MHTQRRRPRLVIAFLVVATAGTTAGLAAAAKVGPFDALGVATRQVAAPVTMMPLRAGSLYPLPTQPPTLHQVIQIHDPAVIEPSSPPPQVRELPPSEPAHPSPTSEPTPKPCDDDCQGGGGDG